MDEELTTKIQKEIKDPELARAMCNYIWYNSPSVDSSYVLKDNDLYLVRVEELLDDNTARITCTKITIHPVCYWCGKTFENAPWYRCSRCSWKYHISCQEELADKANRDRCNTCKDRLIKVISNN